MRKIIIKNTGFTLVELLVVVSIIAILSTIGLTLFTSAQKNARDARRKADIDAIAKALETSRTPTSIYYTFLPSTGFSGGVVPTDTTTAKYCIKTSRAATVPGDAAWAAGDGACPTLPAATNTSLVFGESSWTEIPSTGVSAGVVGTPATAFQPNTISWKVCAQLEAGGTFCKGSAQ